VVQQFDIAHHQLFPLHQHLGIVYAGCAGEGDGGEYGHVTGAGEVQRRVAGRLCFTSLPMTAREGGCILVAGLDERGPYPFIALAHSLSIHDAVYIRGPDKIVAPTALFGGLNFAQNEGYP